MIRSDKTTIFAASTLVLAIGALGIAVTSGGSEAQNQQAPTYSKNIAAILYANCTTCHRPGGLGPMSLLTYDDAKAAAGEMRNMVGSLAMPPWHADAPRGKFLNDRRLSDADRIALLRWVEAGAPQGIASETPRAPTYSNAWSIGTPDTVLSMSTEYEVPAQGTIEYQYFEIPTNFAEERWIQAIEILPGAREVVHHVLVYAREPVPVGRPQVIRQRADRNIPPTPPPTTPPPAGSRPGGRRVLGSLIATTAPGTNAQTFPEGTALRIGPGAVLTLQMHYTAHGTAMKDRSSVGIVFAKAPPQQEIRASNFINGQLVIPAGAAEHRVDSEVSFTEPVHIWAMLPHTHLRGKKWEYKLVKPDGTSEVILSVPRYDFNWQTYYQFAQPLAIPVGARIEASAWYDNSSGNRANPDPTKEVRWGDQTWEEMQYTGFLYTVDSRRR